MSAQTRYGYSTPIGAPGGIVDIAPYAIDTFANEEANGVMKFGLGVVNGTKPGKTVKKPVAASLPADFVGIVTNNRTAEYDMEGAIFLRKDKAMGVMRYGRIYARVPSGLTIVPGTPAYLIVSGDNAGCFTNDSAAGIDVKARFLAAADAATLVAPVELFNEARQNPTA